MARLALTGLLMPLMPLTEYGDMLLAVGPMPVAEASSEGLGSVSAMVRASSAWWCAEPFAGRVDRPLAADVGP